MDAQSLSYIDVRLYAVDNYGKDDLNISSFAAATPWPLISLCILVVLLILFKIFLEMWFRTMYNLAIRTSV